MFCRFKLIKWWAQSFLLGITKIVGGFRDDDGVVHHLQDYQTQEIPSLVKASVLLSIFFCQSFSFCLSTATPTPAPLLTSLVCLNVCVCIFVYFKKSVSCQISLLSEHGDMCL